MRLREFLSTDVETSDAGAGAEEAWRRMKDLRIRHLVVVRGREVVGVLSERDLGGPGGAAARRGRTVAELMTPGAVTAGPETTVREAANLLRGRGLGCLPVVQDARLVGIVTTTDLLDLLGRGAERPAARPERRVLRRRAPRPAESRPRAARG